MGVSDRAGQAHAAGAVPSDRHVAIIGSGLIGQAWAIVFARGGCRVAMWDGSRQALAQAKDLIAGQLQDLAHYGLVDDPQAIGARITVASTLEQAVAGAIHVQENLPERVAVKREIFAKLDAASEPDAVLASSTSSIPASAFTEALAGRERCLVAHPVNPPYLVPVVELCPAPWTADETVRRTWELLAAVGQKPVHVRRELEGFVLNRLQGALLREAFRLVEQGYVDAEGLDRTVRDGLGLRWSFMGPFETIDLNAPGGIADYCERYGPMYQSIAMQQTDTSAWAPALIEQLQAQRRQVLPESQLAERRAWRDRRLMELAALKRRAERAEQQGSAPPAAQG